MKQYIKDKPLKWSFKYCLDVTVKQVTSINWNCTKGKRRRENSI